MIVSNIILGICINLAILTIKQVDWSNGYSCPSYCDVYHKHIGLDLQSNLERNKNEGL